MREIALACGVKNKGIIEFLHANSKAKIDFCESIITTYQDKNFIYLLFACEDKYYKPCEAIIRDMIIDYIESVYKLNYLEKKIKNPRIDALTFNAYIKVLAIFDRTTDETALSKIILFNQTFFVDSFLEFRLTPLKKHWDNLAELSSDNITLFSSRTFLDVIKFLLNTMDNLVYKVKVVYDGELFSLYNMKNKNAQLKKIGECKENIDLISKILNLCPSYIDIYLCKDKTSEAVSFLSSVFTNRLKIIMKNP